MPSAVADQPVTTEGMAKSNKKPTGGRHSTPRVNVGVPEPWHAVLRKIAAKRQQPVLYAIIALAKAEAEKLGIGDMPPAPWEDEGDESSQE